MVTIISLSIYIFFSFLLIFQYRKKISLHYEFYCSLNRKLKREESFFDFAKKKENHLIALLIALPFFFTKDNKISTNEQTLLKKKVISSLWIFYSELVFAIVIVELFFRYKS